MDVIVYYAIDYDTRSVESKSSDGELLAAYVIDNKLTSAIALIDNEEELCLQLSLNEMQELSNNLGGNKEYKEEEEAAEWCWRLLEQSQDCIPNFTKTLGKHLLREAASESKSRKKATDTRAEVSAVKPTKKLRTSSTAVGRRPTDTTVLSLCKQPTEGTLLFKIWQTVEDNLGDMSIGDIVAECELDEQQCRKQISRCIRKGVLIKVEEDL